jgi:cytochrome P450
MTAMPAPQTPVTGPTGPLPRYRTRLSDLAFDAKVSVRWAGLHGLPRLVLTRTADKPGNVLGALMRDPLLRQDPFARHDRLRTEGPLLHSDFAFSTTHHAVAHALLRDPRFGVEGRDKIDLPGPLSWLMRISDPHLPGPADPPAMLGVDPPQHTRYRRLVTATFTPRAIENYRMSIQLTAHRLLDELADRPEVDLARTYASKLPVMVITELLGAPEGEHENFLELGHAIAATLDPGLAYKPYVTGLRALRRARALFDDHFTRLRREPTDSLLGRLAAVAETEDGLTNDELMGIVLLVLGAGFETTVNLLGNGTVLLLRHRDQLDRVLDEPSMWGDAVEEILRYMPPVQLTSRIALQDVEFEGHTIPKGFPVLIFLNAANRDPAIFTDPHRFDVGRENAREHLSFSGGIHFCPGAGLARMEGEIALRTLWERFPDVALAGAPVRRDLITIGGYESIPIRLGRRGARVVDLTGARQSLTVR